MCIGNRIHLKITIAYEHGLIIIADCQHLVPEFFLFEDGIKHCMGINNLKVGGIHNIILYRKFFEWKNLLIRIEFFRK